MASGRSPPVGVNVPQKPLLKLCLDTHVIVPGREPPLWSTPFVTRLERRCCCGKSCWYSAALLGNPCGREIRVAGIVKDDSVMSVHRLRSERQSSSCARAIGRGRSNASTIVPSELEAEPRVLRPTAPTKTRSRSASEASLPVRRAGLGDDPSGRGNVVRPRRRSRRGGGKTLQCQNDARRYDSLVRGSQRRQGRLRMVRSRTRSPRRVANAAGQAGRAQQRDVAWPRPCRAGR